MLIRVSEALKWALLAAVAAAMCAQAQEHTQLSTTTAMARVAKKVTPDFPVAARQLNVQGQSEVQVVVNAQGDVEDAKVVKGNAMFSQSSLAAVKQWKFTPLMKDGQPEKFSTVIVFNYQK